MKLKIRYPKKNLNLKSMQYYLKFSPLIQTKHSVFFFLDPFRDPNIEGVIT